MFTFSGRFRRRVAVLSVLSLLASVLVVAAPAAAADPKADYTATFSACVGAAAEYADFTDVADSHANAGDINCIAYYRITIGTGDGTTYSPSTSVTREHMALFLTRLAGLVGIEVASDPADPGFTDTGGLSTESQTAIAQLASLGITKGTSATTYAPAEPVTRDHMALFISRLMDKMTPLADGVIGLSSTTQFGYVPSDVEDNDKEADILSPFGDIDDTTKNEYDAITRLYELGVAAGASGHPTDYSPDADITRASMAGFMAAVLDHSNARPAGLTLSSSDSVVWGEGSPTLLASVRDGGFMPVEDQSIDMFSSTAGDKALRKDGTCNFQTDPDDVFGGDFVSGDCVWNDNDEATDVSGNLFVPETVTEGTKRLFYSWIGTEDGDKFDADDVDAASLSTVTVKAKHDQEDLIVSSTINKRADDGYDLDPDDDDLDDEGQKVDLRATSTVTFTAQLVDESGSPVARSGVEIRIQYEQGPTGKRSYINTHEETKLTDENGQVSYTVTGPSDDPKDDEQTRADDITFIEVGTDREGEDDVYWVEEPPVLTSDRLGKAAYLLQSSSGSVSATVYLYDQYGNPHRSHNSQKVNITIEDDDSDDSTVGSDVRQVISRGYARWTKTKATLTAGVPVGISYDIRMLQRNSSGVATLSTDTNADVDLRATTYNDGAVITATDGADDNTADHAEANDHDNNPDTDEVTTPFKRPTGDQVRKNIINTSAQDLYDPRGTNVNNDGSGMVQVVEKADSRDTDKYTVHTILADDNEFLADGHLADGATELTLDGDADLVYSYDNDDIFIDSTDEALEISMDRFESMLGRDLDADRDSPVSAVVEVIAYDVDGTSIFRVTTKAA